jgi:hypothetical protein
MLDPRYKNSVFSPGDRTNAFNLIIAELEKLQEIEQPSINNSSPPQKRAKTTDSLDFMEATLDELDERRQSLEGSGLKVIENVGLKFIY